MQKNNFHIILIFNDKIIDNFKTYFVHNLSLKKMKMSFDNINKFFSKKEGINIWTKLLSYSYLFKYFSKESSLVEIVMKNNEIGLVIYPVVIKYSERKLFLSKKKLFFPYLSIYSNIFIVAKLSRSFILKIKNKIQNSNYRVDEEVEILVLTEHFIHEEIWDLIIQNINSRFIKINFNTFGDNSYKIDNIDRFYTNSVKKILNKNQYFSFINDFKKIGSIFKSYNFRKIITFCEHNQNAAIISYFANKNKRISINIAHAISFGWHRSNSPFDYHIVFGKSSLNYLKSMGGIVLSKIVPLGSPRVDKLFKFLKNDYSFEEGTICFLSDTLESIGGKIKSVYVNETILLCKKYNIKKLLIKPHPREDIRFWDNIIKQENFVEILPLNSSIEDVVICQFAINIGWSASALEIAMLRKRLINLNYHGAYDFLNLKSHKFSEVVNNFSEYEKSFKKFLGFNMLSKNDVNDFLDEHLEYVGNSAKTIANFLEKL